MMDWIILFSVSWILFLFLVNFRELKVNIFCGLIAMVLQFAVDTTAIRLGLYELHNQVVSLYGSSLLFMVGPIFTIGVLMAQFHPVKRFYGVLNIFILTVMFSSEEILLLLRKDLVYNEWGILESVVVNIFAMVFLSWFSVFILRKRVVNTK